MPNPISYITQAARDQFTQVEKASVKFANYIGRKVDHFRYDIVPDVVKKIKELSLDILKDYFIALPSLAFSLGHYGDAGVALMVGTVGGLDWVLNDRDFREGSSLFLGLPIAINLGIRVFKTATEFSGFRAVGVIIQAICLAKLILIGRGENSNHED